MKKYTFAVVTIAISTFCLSFLPNKTVTYCGREYIEKKVNVYLKDENIKAVMMSVLDKKSNKQVLGYFASAVRNDTNFIYTKFNYIGDTIIRKEYRCYNITRGLDSSISKFICTKQGILFHNHQTFYKGKIKNTTYYNLLVGK